MRRLLLLLLICAAPAFANNVYVAQNSAGGNTGADCADAVAVGYFNSSGNWTGGTPTGIQIGPGTTVHLCGTFTGGAGSTILTLQGSGASGNQITVVFESGAELEAPYWSTNGAIYLNGQSHIVINGGANGTIATTANGTSLTFQQACAGIYSGYNGSDVEVENITITPVYTIVGDDESNVGQWAGTVGIKFDEGYDLLKIHNNNISWTRIGILVQYTTAASIAAYSNTIDYSSWQIVIGDANNGSHASGVETYANNLGPHFQAFEDSGQAVHGDGIFYQAVNSGSTIGGDVYGNYVHGDMCILYGNCTGYLFLDGGVTVNAFNNVFSQDTAPSSGGGVEADIVIRGDGNPPNGVKILNNTIIAASNSAAGIKTDAGGGSSAGSGIQFENNIFQTLGTAAILSGPNNFNQISASNYQDFHSATQTACKNVSSSGTCYTTLANWQAQTIAGSVNPDGSSSTGDPMLNSSFIPQSGSAAIGLGTNLCSLSITALDSDAAASPRPCPSGAWTAGAYNSGTPTVATPVISPGTGTINSPQTVTITDATSGASIYYSTTGTATCSSTLYTAPFSQGFSGSVTISAIGCLGGYTNSSTTSVTYTQSSGTNGTPAACPVCGVFARKD